MYINEDIIGAGHKIRRTVDESRSKRRQTTVEDWQVTGRHRRQRGARDSDRVSRVRSCSRIHVHVHCRAYILTEARVGGDCDLELK